MSNQCSTSTGSCTSGENDHNLLDELNEQPKDVPYQTHYEDELENLRNENKLLRAKLVDLDDQLERVCSATVSSVYLCLCFIGQIQCNGHGNTQ